MLDTRLLSSNKSAPPPSTPRLTTLRRCSSILSIPSPPQASATSLGSMFENEGIGECTSATAAATHAASRHVSEAMTSVGARLAAALESVPGDVGEEARSVLASALRNEVKHHRSVRATADTGY